MGRSTPQARSSHSKPENGCWIVVHPETDFRIGVMLAHGGASLHSGRLYSPAGVPKVLDSAALDDGTIQSHLTRTLSQSVADFDEANGELLFHSLARSLEADRLAEIRLQGFYRESAALSVVFVGDENEGCFDPKAAGLDSFPDYVPSIRGYEPIAYSKYCVDSQGSPLLTPAKVRERLLAFKPDQALSIASITHVDPARVPRGGPGGSEDSIGHGLIDIARLEPSGVVIDIAETSYAEGLSELGELVSTQIELLTSFTLDGQATPTDESVRVWVDGREIEAIYDAATRSVRIRSTDAGKSGSVIDVSACRKR